jgi:quinol monooxygenase YgiN
MSQLTHLAFFRARAGQTQALGAALSDLVEPTRREAECINYDLHQSAEDIDVWFVHENWRSLGGLDTHMKTAHVQAFLEVAPALVDGAIELRRFTMTSMPAAPRG